MSEDRYDFGYKFNIDPLRAGILHIVFMSFLALIVYVMQPYPISLQTAVSTLIVYTFE